MLTQKNTLKKLCKYTAYGILFFFSVIYIIFVSSFSSLFFSTYKYRETAQQQIAECVENGNSEESCKARVY